MALFPQLGPTYYNEQHKDLLARMEAFYSESITTNYAFWGEADVDMRFHSGDQTVLTDIYGNLPVHRKRNFSFNRIRRVINMISGYQRKNRKSTIITPMENADEITADQFTKIMFWIQKQEGVLETISQAFEGSLITGMNLLNVWVDYRSDPISGNIKVDNCSYNSFLIDPFFKKQDLSDCNAIWKRSFVSKREAVSLLPDYADEIKGLWGTESGTGRDGKFQFMAESYGYSYKNLLTYDEFYYRGTRSQELLVDTQTGETFEWPVDDQAKLRQFLQQYPQVTVVEQDIPTVRLAIVVQGKVMYDGPQPSGIDSYPFVPVLAYYHPEIPYFPYRVQGVVRGLRDAQYLYNRRRGIELDILESQIASGWIYKENALVNPKDVFLSGQGRGLALKEEANMADVQQIQPPQVPPSMIQLSELLAKEVMEVSGVNEELLGSAVDDKAGILSMLRQGAGLTTLQKLFDQLDYSQKLLGSLMLKIVQTNFAPGKVKRILEQEPSPQFYNKNFGTYDVAVEEGLNTTTQRQMEFAQLLHLREVGVPIPDDLLLNAATVQNKKELRERIIQNNQQQQQQQQMQTQATVEEIKARTNLANARAEADSGLGQERVSRIQENYAMAGERKAQAERDHEAALLDRVKALKELENIDIMQLEKLLALARTLQPPQQGVEVGS
jgi:hypothetical protein